MKKIKPNYPYKRKYKKRREEKHERGTIVKIQWVTGQDNLLKTLDMKGWQPLF